MKRIFPLLLCVFLAGCQGRQEDAMAFRSRLLRSEQVTFQAEITADYGDKLQGFTLGCTSDGEGNVDFQVLAPESIAGISGEIAGGEGKLTYDDVTLGFDLIAEDLCSPVSSPWVILKALRRGDLTAVSADGELTRLTISDTLEEEKIVLDVWLNKENNPVQADICKDGRRYLCVALKDFAVQPGQHGT